MTEHGQSDEFLWPPLHELNKFYLMRKKEKCQDGKKIIAKSFWAIFNLHSSVNLILLNIFMYGRRWGENAWFEGKEKNEKLYWKKIIKNCWEIAQQFHVYSQFDLYYTAMNQFKNAIYWIWKRCHWNTNRHHFSLVFMFFNE